MKSLKNTIFESIIFFGVCGLALILYKQGLFPNMSESVIKAMTPISLVLAVGFIFVVLISYLKYREIKCNPKSKEAFEIYDTDERNIYLKDKTNSKTYDIFNIIEIPLSLILLFIGFDELGIGLMIYHFLKEGIRFSIYMNLSKKY
ncbi:MAG: hypothetical protein RR891_05340 [Clostridium sp.]|uniref:hypothetical protein n=1 Tax=Clostridium sp. TaxID=1506 RepID=UPI003052C883